VANSEVTVKCAGEEDTTLIRKMILDLNNSTMIDTTTMTEVEADIIKAAIWADQVMTTREITYS